MQVREPRYGFGSSSREHASRLYVGHQFAGSSPNLVFSPGPTTASRSLVSALGKQSSSRGRTSSAWGFGSATRFPKHKDEFTTPGPGAYG